MFFLVKCAFWLGIVFYLMPWPAQEGPAVLARRGAADLAERAQQAVAERAAGACAADPQACLDFARQAAGARRAAPHQAALRATFAD